MTRQRRPVKANRKIPITRRTGRRKINPKKICCDAVEHLLSPLLVRGLVSVVVWPKAHFKNLNVVHLLFVA